MDLDKAIQNRKSVRHFSDKKPSWKKIIECVDSARYAPRAGNLFPLKFTIVDDPKIIQKLAEASQQPFVGEAQYVVVICSDCKLALNAYKDRADRYCRQQAGASIQNMLLKIEEAGMKTCWIGYFVDYLVREAIGAPEDIYVEAMLPIGLESKKRGTSRAKTRMPDLNKHLYFNKWKNKRMRKDAQQDI